MRNLSFVAGTEQSYDNFYCRRRAKKLQFYDFRTPALQKLQDVGG
jgi:hypothetical protein